MTHAEQRQRAINSAVWAVRYGDDPFQRRGPKETPPMSKEAFLNIGLFSLIYKGWQWPTNENN